MESRMRMYEEARGVYESLSREYDQALKSEMPTEQRRQLWAEVKASRRRMEEALARTAGEGLDSLPHRDRERQILARERRDEKASA